MVSRARYWRGVAGEILGEQDDDGDDAPLMQICCATTARSAPVFHSISGSSSLCHLDQLTANIHSSPGSSDLPLRAARKVPVAPTASEIESMDRHHVCFPHVLQCCQNLTSTGWFTRCSVVGNGNARRKRFVVVRFVHSNGPKEITACSSHRTPT